MDNFINIYEGMTSDFILERLLSRVPDTIDKRQGSIIYDALAPTAIEIGIMYYELAWILRNSFIDTAERSGLISLAADRGIKPYPATYSIVKGEFDVPLELGTRFNYNELNFVVTELLETTTEYFIYSLQCEMSGVAGNIAAAKLLPIDSVTGLRHAFITEIIKPGEEEEDTDALRERVLNSFGIAYGGNIEDYKNKVKAIEGVGGVKVEPVWNGGGTVKVIFTSSDFQKPSVELVAMVQEILDPVPFHQQGAGVAPIGHYVTVEGAVEKAVNIHYDLMLEAGTSYADIEPKVNQFLDEFFTDLRRNWEKTANIVIRQARIEALFLDIPGVVDINSVTIDGQVTNVTLQPNIIPVKGVVTNA